MICASITPAMECPAARAEVRAFAAETFLRQQRDWLDVRRRSKEADTWQERERCRVAALRTLPPTFEACLEFSRRIRLRRERDAQLNPRGSTIGHTDKGFRFDG